MCYYYNVPKIKVVQKELHNMDINTREFTLECVYDYSNIKNLFGYSIIKLIRITDYSWRVEYLEIDTYNVKNIISNLQIWDYENSKGE